MDDYFNRYNTIDGEFEVELERARGLKRRSDWILIANYAALGIMDIYVLGRQYDYAFKLLE